MLLISACNTQNINQELPQITSIISLSPPVTEILLELGVLDKIIAIDKYSRDISYINPSVTLIDTTPLDLDTIINLDPNIVIVSTTYDLDQLTSAGITSLYIPNGNTIADIKNNIMLIANTLDIQSKGTELTNYMAYQIDHFKQIGQTIQNPRRVYFEIYPSPYFGSFGSHTILHELLEIVGATNIFAAYQGFITVPYEKILELDPEIIIASANIHRYPVAEILSRPGFEDTTAAHNNWIFPVNTAANNIYSHNIIQTLHKLSLIMELTRFCPFY